MKHYYKFEIDGEEDYCNVYSSDEPLRKGDYAVVPAEGFFKVACAKSQVNALAALTGGNVEDIICKIDVSAYLEKQNALAQNVLIERAMAKKMAELKNLDTLKKFADKDPEMAVLFETYKRNLSENPVDWSDAVNEDETV